MSSTFIYSRIADVLRPVVLLVTRYQYCDASVSRVASTRAARISDYDGDTCAHNWYSA